MLTTSIVSFSLCGDQLNLLYVGQMWKIFPGRKFHLFFIDIFGLK